MTFPRYYHSMQKGVLVKLDYIVQPWALGLVQTIEDRDTHDAFLCVPARATCPFCGETVIAVAGSGGYWYALDSPDCHHNKGIYSGGRLGFGDFHFEGGVPNTIKWTAEDFQIDDNGLLHFVNILNSMEKKN